MIKDEIKKILGESAEVEIPADKKYGDYSTNVALVLAKKESKNPMDVAREMELRIKNYKLGIFDKIEVAAPGFINFFISKEYLQKELKKILKEKEKYGNLKIGKKQKINVEFISANPTGPLTLGNGRGGFGGDVLSNVLEKAGFDVIREFYVNDHGKQIKNLEAGLYKGEERTADQIQKENRKIIEEKLKIKFDVWFPEKDLYKKKEVDRILNYLKKKKLLYEKGGALWFKSTQFGDDKDRVLVKEDGEKTYFASDIAYLKNKFNRKFKKLIIFLGADHHGYMGRMKAAVEALGYKKEQLDFIILQMVRLIEGGKEVKMSKRAGVFIEIEELIDEVGLDAARFFFLARGANSHLNFDMDLAKKKSQENPVYYTQYAHARICSILHKMQNANFEFKISNFELLDDENELALIKKMMKFPEIIKDISGDYQTQRLPQYTIELAEAFHKFYEKCQVLSGDKKLSEARIALAKGAQIILKNSFNLMGISVPEKM